MRSFYWTCLLAFSVLLMLIERDSNLRLYIGNSSWADTLSSQRISVYIFVFH